MLNNNIKKFNNFGSGPPRYIYAFIPYSGSEEE
jgi:hypothetical protein